MDRVVDIKRYWTNVIKGVGEFQQIANAENPEFNNLTGCLTRLLSDTFINDATEYGVERWEKILNIIPPIGSSLDDRKVQVLTLLNIKLPYTYRMLENAVKSIFGEDNYTMSINNETYILNLEANFTSDNQYRDVCNLFQNVVPENLVRKVVKRS